MADDDASLLSSASRTSSDRSEAACSASVVPGQCSPWCIPCAFVTAVLVLGLAQLSGALRWLLVLLARGTPLPPGYCGAAAAAAPAPPAANASAADFAAWALGLVARMAFGEKRSLLNGVGYSAVFRQSGWYVGNALAVPRLGIPPVQMQDAAQGFRTMDARMIGQVTAWPCALAVAASWDANATWHWARAIGEEFRAKGANVLLGPAVNVHRVAANGRNAEYISGEDPALGAVLAAAYVRGVQEGAGVATVVKHFAMNEQETARDRLDVRVDERTRWEQYYPPFEAAVQAGAAAVMCSYNLVNGKHACENSQLVTEDLKGRMRFPGWVVSDWWALTSASGAGAGTDQDMPGTDGHFSAGNLRALPPSRLDDMVSRVLAGLARSGAWSATPAGACRAGCDCERLLYGTNATSEAHMALARTLAADAAVLLQNGPWAAAGRRALPLRPGERVAVLGRVCAAKPDAEAMAAADLTAGDYYVVGGSGRVLSPRTVSVLEGLRGRGLRLSPSASDSAEDLAAALAGADVAVVCGGATTAESFDRASLKLDNEAFLAAVLRRAAAARVPVVVVALAPGAIVAPWRHEAAAVLTMFLSGQETGNAAADVLLGTVNPSGKLPVTFPEREEDAIWPCRGSPLPSAAVPCEYKERLKGGWHVYDGKPVAFPFGHGLSYTEFQYTVVGDWAAPPGGSGSGERRLAIRVRNVGGVAGAEVAQLYLRPPPEEAEEPRLVLRGLCKSPVLLPGEAHDVAFSLTPRDLSVWDHERHAWRQLNGRFRTFVGASSRDLKLCGGFRGAEVEPMRPC